MLTPATVTPTQAYVLNSQQAAHQATQAESGGVWGRLAGTWGQHFGGRARQCRRDCQMRYPDNEGLRWMMQRKWCDSNPCGMCAPYHKCPGVEA